MTQELLYSIAGIGLFGVGLLGVIVAGHVMRKILSLNVMGVGVFMFFIAIAQQHSNVADPLPHAMVLTGIVIAVAGTAMALSLMVRIYQLDHSDDEQ